MNNNFKPIGFIGIGLMGASFVKRLSELNYLINAYDKRKEKLESLNNKKRVTLCANPAQVCKNCDIRFICVDKTENV